MKFSVRLLSLCVTVILCLSVVPIVSSAGTMVSKPLTPYEITQKMWAYYKEVSKSMTEACQNLKTVMDTWVNKRLAMIACFEEQGIGISETFKLLDNIKKIGELEK